MGVKSHIVTEENRNTSLQMDKWEGLKKSVFSSLGCVCVCVREGVREKQDYSIYYYMYFFLFI